MLNRALIILGVPFVLIGMPFVLFDTIKPIFDSYWNYPDSIVLTSAYSMVPFLSWFWFLSFAGFLCICLKKQPNLSKRVNKYLGTYIPCFLFLIGIGIGTIGKEVIKAHLIDKGYLLITTEKLRTSFYIPYDKDIYRKVN
ncbi:hypothetical protein J7I01_004846 [Vibrio parahaemolyticus]|nr:hypothetical protein [Vibrio parahaemolyticus]